jgi:hypothetical protein
VLLLTLPLVLLLLCRCGGSKRERDECERSLLTSLDFLRFGKTC